MAISVNATVTTEEGFEVTNLYGWVDTYVLQSNWANMSYYKSKQDFIGGKSPLNVASLPSRVATNIDNTAYWGTTFNESIHDTCIAAIEEVTGADTCTIDMTEPTVA